MFSRILSDENARDENAIQFTLSDVENCQILGFSGVNRTASLTVPPIANFLGTITCFHGLEDKLSLQEQRNLCQTKCGHATGKQLICERTLLPLEC